MFKYKKNFLIFSLLSTISFSTLNATEVIDPEVMDGWKLSQKRELSVQCMTMLYNDTDRGNLFPEEQQKKNVCECFAYEYMSRFTYPEMIQNRIIEFRRIGKIVGTYKHEVLQTAEDSRIASKWESEALAISRKCATEEVATNGINPEDYSFYK